jgi:hypothetical protein
METPPEAASGTARFFAYDYTEPDKTDVTANYYSFMADRKAVGARCEVWVEQGAEVSAGDAREIAAEFDTAIYPAILNTFGFEVDLEDGSRMNILDAGDYYTNRDGKLLLMLMRIRGGNSGDKYVAGLFNGNDLFDNGRSNKADMLYIDVRNLKSRRFYAAIAHEYQHLLHFIMDLKRRENNGALITQDTWINEGLSTAAEYAYLGSHEHTGRVAHFNASSSQEDTFFTWDGSLDDYASAYLFFQWLRIQAGGEGIYRDILGSAKSGVGAVTEAAVKNGIPAGDWESLLRAWFAANYIKTPTGLFGYNGQIDPVIRAVSGSGETTVMLRPGEGVYSARMPSSDGGGTAHIKYAGLDRVGREVRTGGVYPGWMWLLTFNANADPRGNAEGGAVFAATPSVPAGARSAAPAASYPVSAADLRGGRRPDEFILPETREGGYCPVSMRQGARK